MSNLKEALIKCFEALQPNVTDDSLGNLILQLLQSQKISSPQHFSQLVIQLIVDSLKTVIQKHPINTSIESGDLPRVLVYFRAQIISFQRVSEDIIRQFQSIGEQNIHLLPSELSSKFKLKKHLSSIQESLLKDIQKILLDLFIPYKDKFGPQVILQTIQANISQLVGKYVKKLSNSEAINNIHNIIGCFRSLYIFENIYYFDFLSNEQSLHPSINELRHFFICELFKQIDFFNLPCHSQFCTDYFSDHSFIQYRDNFIWLLLNGNNEQSRYTQENSFSFPIQGVIFYWPIFSHPSILVHFPELLYSYYSKKFREIKAKFGDPLIHIQYLMDVYNEIYLIWRQLSIIENGSFLRCLPGFSDFIFSLKRILFSLKSEKESLYIDSLLAVVLSLCISDFEKAILFTQGHVKDSLDTLKSLLQPNSHQNKPITKADLAAIPLFSDTSLIRFLEFFEWVMKILYVGAEDQKITCQSPILGKHIQYMVPNVVSRLFNYGPKAAEIEKVLIGLLYNFLPPQSLQPLTDIFEPAPQLNISDLAQSPLKIKTDIDLSNEIDQKDLIPNVHFFLIEDPHCFHLNQSKLYKVKMPPAIFDHNPDKPGLINSAFSRIAPLISSLRPKEGISQPVDPKLFFFEDSMAIFRINALGQTHTFIGHPFQLAVMWWLKENGGVISRYDLAEKMEIAVQFSTEITLDDILSTICFHPTQNNSSLNAFFPCVYLDINESNITFNKAFFECHHLTPINLRFIDKASFICQPYISESQSIHEEKIKAIRDFMFETVKSQQRISESNFYKAIVSGFPGKIFKSEIVEAFRLLQENNAITIIKENGSNVIEYCK